MANFKYFTDTAAGTVEAGRADYRKDGPYLWSGTEWLKVTRVIEMKTRPSRHACDDRCVHARGRIMKCECSCGGKNHGRGAKMAEAA